MHNCRSKFSIFLNFPGGKYNLSLTFRNSKVASFTNALMKKMIFFTYIMKSHMKFLISMLYETSLLSYDIAQNRETSPVIQQSYYKDF